MHPQIVRGEPGTCPICGKAQVVKTLQVKPELCARAEEVGQTQRGVTGDDTLPVQNAGDAVVGTSSLRASSAALIPSSISSSAKCSPGCIVVTALTFSYGSDSSGTPRRGVNCKGPEQNKVRAVVCIVQI